MLFLDLANVFSSVLLYAHCNPLILPPTVSFDGMKSDFSMLLATYLKTEVAVLSASRHSWRPNW